MLPYAKKTMLMMQNFHHNYCYNNHAGVLFTMNGTDDINNGCFLKSDPNFCSGGMTIQDTNAKLAHIGNTQESMIRDEISSSFLNKP
jgi:hypothetical protein